MYCARLWLYICILFAYKVRFAFISARRLTLSSFSIIFNYPSYRFRSYRLIFFFILLQSFLSNWQTEQRSTCLPIDNRAQSFNVRLLCSQTKDLQLVQNCSNWQGITCSERPLINGTAGNRFKVIQALLTALQISETGKNNAIVCCTVLGGRSSNCVSPHWLHITCHLIVRI